MNPSSSDEVWLPVPGFEGRYEVSDQGRVRSLPRWHGRPGILSGTTQKVYRAVTLWRNNQPTTFRVNRLVATVFHGEPQPGQVCRHLNGDSLDNRADNLAWGSTQENVADTLRMGRHAQKNKTHCKNGHEFAPENTRVERNARGVRRYCRICVAQAERERRLRIGKVNCPDCSAELWPNHLVRHRKKNHDPDVARAAA